LKSSPKPGDLLLLCKHKRDIRNAHVFELLDGMPFTRPDGSKGVAQWVFICDECFKSVVVIQGKPATCAPLSFDITWEEGDRVRYRESS
jgi:hypothetical protein